MDDELDELDLAVLNIGLEDNSVLLERSATQDLQFSCNLKPLLETPERNPLESYQRLCETDDTSKDGNKELGKKNRRRRGKSGKKQPRRLPVDELVLAYERVAELNPPNDSGNYSGNL